MQLIFETEAHVNIAEKMTSVDAMSIAESKPDSQPEGNKVSICISMEKNNLLVDTVKRDENRTSEEQNGNANITSMTELPEVNDVKKDKENDISAQTSNIDIALKAEIDNVEPTSENTELEQPVSDSENLMQVEKNLPRIPGKLKLNTDGSVEPENRIDSFANEKIKQQAANKNDNEVKIKNNEDVCDDHITENISHRQEQHDDTTHTEIKESDIAKSDIVQSNGVACEAKFQDMVEVTDSTEVHSDDKELTESNQAEKTKTFDCSTEEKQMQKDSSEDQIKSTYCTVMGFNAADSTSEDIAKLSDNILEKKTKTSIDTQENTMESTNGKERISSDANQEEQMEVIDQAESIHSTDKTEANKIEVTAHEEEIKSTDETRENKMEAINNHEGTQYIEETDERNMETQENEMEATINVAGISPTNNTQENKMEVIDQEQKIKCIVNTQENQIESSNQFNLLEGKDKLHSLQCEQKKVDDNNEESVLNVNSDKLGSDAIDKCILNSEEENSAGESKEKCVEKIIHIASNDNLINSNNITNDTQQQDKEDDMKTKDIVANKADFPQQVKENDLMATTLKPMDVDAFEDLFSDNPTVSHKSAKPLDVISDNAISEDIISLDSGKTVNIDSDRKSSPVTVIDCDEIQDIADEESNNILHQHNTENEPAKQKEMVTTKPKKSSKVSGLSNTLDILSDDDDCVEESKDKLPEKTESSANENKCINLDEDDDVMLIDDPPVEKELEEQKSNDYMIIQESETMNLENEDKRPTDQLNTINLDNDSEPETSKSSNEDVCKDTVTVPLDEVLKINAPEISEKPEKPIISPKVVQRPIIPENFLKSFRKNVIDMNRDELEEFCLMKIVEGIIDQTNLSEIKAKLKTITSSVEEWKKKVMSLTKQNKDLQIVLRTVQDEQSKRSDHQVVPLKITRSVGMQVYMAEVPDRNAARRKPPQAMPAARNNRNTMAKPSGKPNSANLPIPVPRLVPAANNSPMKARHPQQVQNATVSSNSPKVVQNGTKTPSPSMKTEKRPFSSVQSVTVDLTDDEPPAKQPAIARNNAQPPVRLVAQQQLMKPRAQIALGNAAARKVFIPINPQNNLRPGQTITLKSVPPNARIRGPGLQNAVPIRVQTNSVRGPRPTSNIRHPAPLPEVAKQQQPPNWKALPPAPDLKISKVENGIVISWKIEGYLEDSYEEIASYQLYAYQETSSPPNTALWKKIGDVKALPLPMACTLTQFMAGYKYYFAVRAVDIRSRIGAFSLPGSILLLNK